MIDGNEFFSRLGKLRDVTCSKDIKQLSYAMFPGTHCPLMGAVMAVRGIEDAYALVVGTDECAYYTKQMMIHRNDFNDRCFSACLNNRDVTFGCKSMLDSAVDELVNEYKPRCVFIITTCVVEVTGDDTDSMCEHYTKKYGVPFLSVHTEHFKCENHIPGLERTLTACFDLMKPCEKDGTVNVLGERGQDFKDTELFSILDEVGVKIGLQLPCGCTLEDIEKAPSAKANIVVNEFALPLAEKMKEKYGIPYVHFENYTDPERIMRTYKSLFEYLGVALPKRVTELYEAAKATVELAKPQLKGMTYFYGNSPFSCLEINNFMVNLGMIPQIIQTVSVEPERDKEYLDDILAKSDPYVTGSANVAPISTLYGILRPNMYLGHEYPARLRKMKISMIHADMAGGMLGFEVTQVITKELMRCAEEARMLQKEA